MSDDLAEFVSLLKSRDVDFLVVGAYAVGFHGYPRYTKDLDIWIGQDLENARRAVAAIKEFGFTLEPDAAENFARSEHSMVRLGALGNSIDVLNFQEGVDFEKAWEAREIGSLGPMADIPYLAKADLIKAKETAGRPQDLVDVAKISRIGK